MPESREVREAAEEASVTTRATDLSYDPYDQEIFADPYPVFRRLREEAPLYYNERYDFFALSRFCLLYTSDAADE